MKKILILIILILPVALLAQVTQGKTAHGIEYYTFGDPNGDPFYFFHGYHATPDVFNMSKDGPAIIVQTADKKFYINSPIEPGYWFIMGIFPTNTSAFLQNSTQIYTDFLNDTGYSNLRPGIITAHSRGAGAFEKFLAENTTFDFSFVVEFAAEPKTITNYVNKNIPMWVIHTEFDHVNPVSWSRDYSKKMKDAGNDLVYYEWPKFDLHTVNQRFFRYNERADFYRTVAARKKKPAPIPPDLPKVPCEIYMQGGKLFSKCGDSIVEL